MQNIELVSNYFEIERRNCAQIPSINLQLIEHDSAIGNNGPVGAGVDHGAGNRMKKYSICSFEIATEYLSKYDSGEQFANSIYLQPSQSSSHSSTESLHTETSDYYRDLPIYKQSPVTRSAISLSSN